MAQSTQLKTNFVWTNWTDQGKGGWDLEWFIRRLEPGVWAFRRPIPSPRDSHYHKVEGVPRGELEGSPVVVKMVLFTLCATFLCTFVLPLSLFLAAVKLWEIYCISGRDRSCGSPLPPGSMGLPFLGETLQLVLQVRRSACSLFQPSVHIRFRILRAE